MVTATSLADDLRRSGLRAGDTVLVHCSLRRVGRLPDGPGTLRAALQEVLTPAGTLVVPTHTAGNSITSHRFRAETAGKTPAEIAAWEAAIEPFDVAESPGQDMGALAEDVRRQPGSLRSRHPQTSFSALGPGAAELVAVHDLDCHLGERSPQGVLYAADATVLMIGVGYDQCTSFHLGEYRLAQPPPTRAYRCYVRDEHGRRQRLDFVAPHLDDSDFPQLGADFHQTRAVRTGYLGGAETRLFPMRAAVDFAVSWMTDHRRS